MRRPIARLVPALLLIYVVAASTIRAGPVQIESIDRFVDVGASATLNEVNDFKRDTKTSNNSDPLPTLSVETTVSDPVSGQTLRAFGTASQNATISPAGIAFSGTVSNGGELSGSEGVNFFALEGGPASEARIFFFLDEPTTLTPALTLDANFELPPGFPVSFEAEPADESQPTIEFRPDLRPVELPVGAYTLLFTIGINSPANDVDTRTVNYAASITFSTGDGGGGGGGGGTPIPLPAGVWGGGAMLALALRFGRHLCPAHSAQT